MELTVECQKRPPNSKPKALRRAGLTPAVLYGHQGAESISLTLSTKTAQTLVKDASINNTLIQVKIPDIRWSGKALLRDVQTHPWNSSLYHLSFFSVAAQDTLEVDVPLHFVGEAPGVKIEGGSLDTVFTELKVQCAPDSIPETIEVDVSHLNMGDMLHVHELNLPPGVTALQEAEQIVVSVLPPQLVTEPAEEVETGTESSSDAAS